MYLSTSEQRRNSSTTCCRITAIRQNVKAYASPQSLMSQTEKKCPRKPDGTRASGGGWPPPVTLPIWLLPQATALIHCPGRSAKHAARLDLLGLAHEQASSRLLPH
jgi:hypothetical protein